MPCVRAKPANGHSTGSSSSAHVAPAISGPPPPSRAEPFAPLREPGDPRTRERPAREQEQIDGGGGLDRQGGAEQGGVALLPGNEQPVQRNETRAETSSRCSAWTCTRRTR